MSVIKEQPEMLAKVNKAIRRVSEKSGSDIIRDLKMVQKLDANSADYIFTGVLDAYGWFYVSGAEITYQGGEDEKMDALVRCRIEGTIHSIIGLLEDELELLGEMK